MAQTPEEICKASFEMIDSFFTEKTLRKIKENRGRGLCLYSVGLMLWIKEELLEKREIRHALVTLGFLEEEEMAKFLFELYSKELEAGGETIKKGK